MSDIFENIMQKVSQAKINLEDNPSFLKKSFAELDTELEKLTQDVHSSDRKEKYKFEITFDGLQLIRFQHIMLIYKNLFGLSEEEVIYYLLNNGIFLKIYELGLIRNKLMSLNDDNIPVEEDLSMEMDVG